MNISLGRYGFVLLLFCSVTISACGGNGPRSTIPATTTSSTVANATGNGASQQLLRINKLHSKPRKALALPSQCDGTEGPNSTATCNIYPGATLTLPASLAPPDPSPYTCTDTPPLIAYNSTPPPGLSVSLTPGATPPCFGTVTATFKVTASVTAAAGSFIDFQLQNNYTLCGAGSCVTEPWNGSRYGIQVVTPPPCATPGTPGPNPTSPVAVTTADGAVLTDPKGNPIMRPDDGHDPAFFIAQGTLDYALFLGAPLVSLVPLLNFRQSGPWDEQRIGGSFNYAYTNYATIAIGLFGAAAGIPEDTLLTIENLYAATKSTFGTYTVYDSTYTHLPKTNVKNTTLGYNLYQSNAFGVCK